MSPDADSHAVETAWRIHSALSDWNGKVDLKASFVLTVESVALAGVLALSAPSRSLATLHSALGHVLYWAGVLALLTALIEICLVVTPRLRSRAVTSEAPENFIYFGHLQHWNEPDLTDALSTKPLLPVLNRQLIVMSKIAWSKHRQVQRSMVAAIAGGVLLLGAAVVG